MVDEPRFSEKWDFRRQENSFDDSSSDDPDSNSTQDPIIHNPNLVLDSPQLDDGTKPVTREQPTKTTRKRRSSKKDEVKPEKAKQVRRRKPKAVCAEESKKKDETVMEMDDVGMFMKTLLDDLTASRESLMDWMNTELYGSSDQNVVSRPPLKKRAVAVVAAQKSVKKRTTKKKKMEEEQKESEKQSKEDQTGQEIARNGRDKVQELDCNAGPFQFDRFLSSGRGGLGRNYFHQQQGQGQEVIVAPETEMDNEKDATLTNQKSVVLAIEAPKLSVRQKKTREANAIKNRSSMVERIGPEPQKDDNFVIPFAPKPSSSSSSSPSLQSFSVGSSLNSLFPSSSQGIASFASNHNFPPTASQIPDLSELQRGLQGFENPLVHHNSYFCGFPAAFQPNLIAGGINFAAQVNPATSSQQRDNNNILGGLRMAGGAIRYSGGNNSLSDYRTGSGK